jgi:hypothetical protein
MKSLLQLDSGQVEIALKTKIGNYFLKNGCRVIF